MFGLQVHAEIEFELLEGAMLALKTLNGLNVQGQPIKVTLFPFSLLPSSHCIKSSVRVFIGCSTFNMFACMFLFQVQRPVYESMLDLDLTLDALMCDRLNTSHLYAVKLNPSRAEWINISATINGHSPVTTANGLPPAKVNGTQLQPTTTKSTLSEETVRETFAHFGPVKSVILPAKPGRHARHAHIRELKAVLFIIPCCAVCVQSVMQSFCVSPVDRVWEFRGQTCGPRLLCGPLEAKLPRLSNSNSTPFTFLGSCGSAPGSSRRRGEDPHVHQFSGQTRLHRFQLVGSHS